MQVTASPEPEGGPEVTLHGGTFTVGGGTVAYGIEVVGGLGTFDHITAQARGGTTENIGLMNEEMSSVVTAIGVSFTGSGGNKAYGIYNIGELTTQNVFALGKSWSTNNGLSLSYGTVRADSCRFKGNTNAVYQTGVCFIWRSAN